jgi:hypothetical protein
VELLPGRTSARIGTVTDAPASLIKPHNGLDGEWNRIEIIARGNTLVHMINGRVISVTIDDNPEFRALQGILSLQLKANGQICTATCTSSPWTSRWRFPGRRRITSLATRHATGVDV